MGKQAWRYEAFETNTRLIEEFCAKHNLTIEYLNNGYQLRINGAIDIYPVRMKYHYLKNGQRGEFDSIEDLDMSIFDHSVTVRNGVMSVPPKDGVKVVRVREPWGDDEPHVIIPWGKQPKKWWQFWKKR